MEFDKDTALAAIQDASRQVEERRQALSWLLSSKALKDEQQALDRSLEAWQRTAKEAGRSPGDRLIATAEIVRIGASNPAMAAASDRSLEQVLSEQLPPLDNEIDGDTRVNVAKGLKRCAPPWAGDYALDMLALEDKSDRVRTELVDLLVGTRPSLSDVLAGMASAFERRASDGAAAAKAHAKRAAKAIETLRAAFAVSDLQPGAEPGEQFDRLVRMAVRPFGNKIDPKIAEELAAQVVRFVQTLIRSRFSLSLEPGTYAAVKRASGFFLRGIWPKSLAEVLHGLERDILEALVLLGRQGVESKSLLEQLSVVAGSRDAAKKRSEAIVQAHPELPENVKFFLTHWQVKFGSGQDSEEIQDAVLAQVDSAIADALVEAERLRRVRGQDDVDQQRVEEAADAMARRVLELAKRRRIDFYGSEGQEMKASPKYFQSESGAVEGIVKRPAVVQIRADGTPGVCLVKGVLA